MESRDSKLIHLVGLIAMHGKDYNELKLEKLLKIVEQADINIEINQDGARAPNEQALSSTGKMERTPTRGTKRVSDDSMNGDSHKKRRAESSVSAMVS